ncbi:hypothetical protein [Nostoc sp. CHAB 5715]|uniref:hypothetical protein n=1 Tax=Nostoc sp. CHAB 5715 TaxID=2780400 RepID=UPI001E56D83B|nr:hypothetical protein [Nostoc sp. CHAB 5715]MCC5622359.1 hypothetical protein [Nostoc sp. CHAB 5715]
MTGERIFLDTVFIQAFGRFYWKQKLELSSLEKLELQQQSWELAIASIFKYSPLMNAIASITLGILKLSTLKEY